MALSRRATDGLINGWKHSHKLEQTAWRGQGKKLNYGQTLRGGGKPSDQAVPGPLLSNNPNSDAWIDVYEAPNGYGWVASFIATDSGQNWIRTVSAHEDGPLVETAWVEWLGAVNPFAPPAPPSPHDKRISDSSLVSPSPQGWLTTAWSKVTSTVRGWFA